MAQNDYVSEYSGEQIDALLNKVDPNNASGPETTPTASSSRLITSGGVKAGLDAKYSKPGSGIPKTDLASGVQTSLEKADSALQSTDVVDNLNSEETAKPLSAKQGKVLKNYVSVSQNILTGHTDITVGSTTTPVASVEDVSQLGQEVDGEITPTSWYQGTINGNTGKYSSNNTRITNSVAVNGGTSKVRVVCSGDVRMNTVQRYKTGYSPVAGGTKDTDWTLESNTTQEATFDANASFPDIYITFARVSSSSSNIDPETVAANVKFITQTALSPRLKQVEDSVHDLDDSVQVLNDGKKDLTKFVIDGNITESVNAYIKELYIPTIDANKTYCVRRLEFVGGNAKLQIWNATDGSDFVYFNSGATDSLKADGKLYVVGSSKLGYIVLKDVGNLTKVVIAGNEDGTKASINNTFVSNPQYSPTVKAHLDDVVNNDSLPRLQSTNHVKGNGLYKILGFSFEEGYRWPGETVGNTIGTKGADALWRSIIILVKSGENYGICCDTAGAGSYRGWATLDSNMKIVRIAGQNDAYTTTPLELTIGSTESYLLVQSRYDAALIRYGYAEKVQDLENVLSEKQTHFQGQFVNVSQNLNEKIVDFHAKPGDRVSFMLSADEDKFKSKYSGTANEGVRSVSGIYLMNGDAIVDRLSGGVFPSINLWHTFFLKDNVDSIKVYVNYNDDIVSGQTPTLTMDVIVGDEPLAIPDYYFANNYLQNKIARINDLARNNDGDTFVFTTDEHWEYNSRVTPSIIKLLENRIDFSRIISTGDHVQVTCRGNSGKTTNADPAESSINKYVFDYYNVIKSCTRKKLLSSIGNHEYLTGSYPAGMLDGEDLHNWLKYDYFSKERGFVFGSREKLYYYYDDTEKQIRYVFLSAFEPSENTERTRTTGVEDYDADQITWLGNVALNVSSGWHIIVVTHNLCGVHFSNPTDNNISITYTNKEKSVIATLLGHANNDKIVAIIAGHTHRDGLILLGDTEAGLSGASATGNTVILVSSTCDANGFNWAGQKISSFRPKGTINEVAFDVVSLGLNKKTISFIRIGAKSALDYHYDGTYEERIVTYESNSVGIGGTKTLSPAISPADGETLAWASSDTTIATVSGGVVTGVAGGYCIITATNTLGQVQVFRVKVTA